MLGEQAFRISRLLSFLGFIAYFVYAAIELSIELGRFADLNVFKDLGITVPTAGILLALIMRWRYLVNLLFGYQFYMVGSLLLVRSLHDSVDFVQQLCIPTAVCFGIPLAYNWVKFGKFTLWLSRNDA